MPAIQEGLTYKKAHLNLRQSRGRAADHACSCGAPARFWAYQYTDPNPMYDSAQRAYSSDPDNYAPMCARCHRQFDIENDPRVGDSAKTCGTWRGGQNRDRLKSDPEYAERMRKINQATAKRVNATRRRCLECGMECNPGPMGYHQKSTGHTGYEELS